YLTYGGYWAADPAAELARRAGCKNVFLLHNLSYRKAPLFDLFDAIVVSSEFARHRYARELGREPTAIPPLIDEGTVCDGKRRSNRSSAAFAAR
ncbi:MAG: hypothetical protein IJM30_12725, partial [Thermoguttaceae bacterium]|nr:hypothetical protein [Thermoguttaceae bacterium]